MLSWINKIVLGKEGVSLPCKPSQEVPDEVITPNPTEGIGEPVLSFVTCFKNNPKRFNVGKLSRVSSYLCLDRETKVAYKLIRFSNGGYNLFTWTEDIDMNQVTCFSHKELNFLYKELILPRMIRYNKVIQRKESIDVIRRERSQRLELTKVYCNEK